MSQEEILSTLRRAADRATIQQVLASSQRPIADRSWMSFDFCAGDFCATCEVAS